MLFSGNISIAATIIHPGENHYRQNAFSEKENLRADVFVKMSAKEFTALTGKKLNLLEKIYFKVSIKKIKRDLKKNPDLLITDYYDPLKKKFKLDSVWFVLGIMIGPLALLFAHTSKRNKASRKSAFLGFLIFVVWFSFFFII